MAIQCAASLLFQHLAGFAPAQSYQTYTQHAFIRNNHIEQIEDSLHACHRDAFQVPVEKPGPSSSQLVQEVSLHVGTVHQILPQVYGSMA